MRAKLSAAGFVLLAYHACLISGARAETWHTRDEKTIPGTLASLRGDTAALLLPDGRVVKAEMDRFTEESQARIRDQARFLPEFAGTGYELEPEFYIHGASLFDAGGLATLATITREGFDVVFRGEEPAIQLFFKVGGKRTGDPILIQYQANSADEQAGLRMKQAAHVPPSKSAPDTMVYRMQMEDESVLSIVCEVKENAIRIAPYVQKNQGITEFFLPIKTPGIATQSNDKGTGYHIGHKAFAPWEDVRKWLRSNQVVFALAGEEPLHLGYDQEPATIPAKMQEVALGGPALCYQTVIMRSEGAGYFSSKTGEATEMTNLWSGYELRYHRGAVDADPRKEALVLRVIPAH